MKLNNSVNNDPKDDQNVVCEGGDGVQWCVHTLITIACVSCVQSPSSMAMPTVEPELPTFADIRVVNFSDCWSDTRNCPLTSVGCSVNIPRVPEVGCKLCMTPLCGQAVTPPLSNRQWETHHHALHRPDCMHTSTHSRHRQTLTPPLSNVFSS